MKTKTPPEVQAAILADYAAGMSSVVAAEKHGVSSSAILRYVRAAGLTRGMTQARIATRKRKARQLEAEIALTGGDWVVRRGVRYWQRWEDVA